MFGNNGKILFVDLTKGTLTEESLSEKIYEDYLGGYGLGVKIIYDRMKPKVDPLGPDNILGFTTGTLVGTPALTGNRFTVCAKSPLTNTWGDANCGGYFAPRLKASGFDAVFFTGISAKPVYLFINNGVAELRDAANLWGKDSVETEDLLEAELGKDIEVACIGPAGENLSLIAGVMHDKGRAAGRSGLGAVMGSKKLKALVVRGTKAVGIADAQAMEELRKQVIQELDRPDVHHFTKYGTIDHVASSAFSNDSPVKNWVGVGVEDFPTATKISDDSILKYEVKKYTCWRCPIACGGVYQVKDGPYAVAEVHKPEYETCGMFGNNLLNDDVESLFRLNDICNRAGLDTISAGAAVGFAIECKEKGLLTAEDLEGVEDLTWGNAAAIVRLTEMIAKNKGLGRLLAQGTLRAAQKIGADALDVAVQVGGQELPAHDPRFAPSWGIYYALDATPGRHTQLGLVPYDQGRGIRGLELPVKIEKYDYQTKGKWAAKVQDILHAVFSCGVCMQAVSRVNIEHWTKALTAVTGKTVTLDDMEIRGRRIATLRQAFNVREGLDVSKITYSKRAYGIPPFKSGPLAGITLDLDTMRRDYYTEQGWDPETGVPTAETLDKLGLSYVKEDIVMR